jgi:pyruvate dehydrogenase E1 component alpha subunit
VEASKQQMTDKDRGLLQVLGPDGTLALQTSPLGTPAILDAYRDMYLARILDEKMIALQRQGRMGTFVSSAGQEALQIGSILALKATDWIFPMYRDLGMAISRDVPLEVLLNRLFGNGEDESLGRDLPNALGWRKYRMFNLAAPIASQLQVAVGFAMAARYRNEETVALTSFGDGATSSGEFHVSMNFAGVFRAQVIFLCENNQYAISVPVRRQTASESIAVKARAYGFEGIRVDGNDLLAVYSETKKAVEKARRGDGPTLIECLTYRLGAHSTSDDWKKYRSVEEVEEWKKKDPLTRLRLYLEKQSVWNAKEEEKLRKELELLVNDQIARAEKVPPPPVESMFRDVYAKLPRSLERQQREELGSKDN